MRVSCRQSYAMFAPKNFPDSSPLSWHWKVEPSFNSLGQMPWHWLPRTQTKAASCSLPAKRGDKHCKRLDGNRKTWVETSDKTCSLTKLVWIHLTWSSQTELSSLCQLQFESEVEVRLVLLSFLSSVLPLVSCQSQTHLETHIQQTEREREYCTDRTLCFRVFHAPLVGFFPFLHDIVTCLLLLMPKMPFPVLFTESTGRLTTHKSLSLFELKNDAWHVKKKRREEAEPQKKEKENAKKSELSLLFCICIFSLFPSSCYMINIIIIAFFFHTTSSFLKMFCHRSRQQREHSRVWERGSNCWITVWLLGSLSCVVFCCSSRLARQAVFPSQASFTRSLITKWVSFLSSPGIR